MSRIVDFFSSLTEINDPEKLPRAQVSDEPLDEAQGLLDDYLADLSNKQYLYDLKLNDTEAGKRIAVLPHEEARRVVLAVLTRIIPVEARLHKIKTAREKRQKQPEGLYSRFYSLHQKLTPVLQTLLRRKLPFHEADLMSLMQYALQFMQESFSTYSSAIPGVVKALEYYAQEHELTESVVDGLAAMDQAFSDNDWGGADERKLQSRVKALIGDNGGLNLVPGEAWSDAAIADIGALPEEGQQHWMRLLQLCQGATSSRPSAKWKQEAKALLEPIGEAQFIDFVSRWFPLVDKPHNVVFERRSPWEPDPNMMLNEQHMDILKGLCWCCPFYESEALARAITAMALSAYKKVPGIGPRATRVGNACVYALGEMPGMSGVYQMALLKVRVNFRTALNVIEKALIKAGKRVGMSVEELEEIGVPAYGLSEVGLLRQELGDFTAELAVTGSNSTELRWQKADGKYQKSVPKAVKDNFGEELKELKATAKDIQKMLPAQRQRLDNLFLQQRQWPLAKWREYYLDHPLVGYLARRLIWSFDNGEAKQQGCYYDGELLGLDNKELQGLNDATQVRLWHPIESDIEEISRWREWLETKEVMQPFKQAHREIYLVTDAERTTHSYSNRFAAHLIKQHQLNALAVQRGWDYTLQGCWDGGGETIAKRVLPKWGLWAEFWVDGVGEYGNGTTDVGIFNYVATDQVRFYAYGGEGQSDTPGWAGASDEGPVPIAEVPPLVLSEIFRDIDLFVGVGSVGNDPEWADGGPEGRYRDYWSSYSFGDLNATAKTRKEVLERLLPRLKIADRCEVKEKFLVVRGDIRSYKIHLGSGNILMTPNDQYLCIVVARGGKGGDKKIYLPFEGDTMMSIILSKAFLLAEDRKITDKTILSQIKP